MIPADSDQPRSFFPCELHSRRSAASVPLPQGQPRVPSVAACVGGGPVVSGGGDPLFVNYLVCEAHREGAVADRSGDLLGGFRSNIAGYEDARPDGFEQIGLA